MANCAANLTPVTLELGGKSPAIVAPDFPLDKAAERILWVKLLNAGQICTNVDYLLLPPGQRGAFVAHAQRIAARRFPDLLGGDYTAIIDQRQYDRLQAVLQDAIAQGARAVPLLPGQPGDAAAARHTVRPDSALLSPTSRTRCRSCSAKSSAPSCPSSATAAGRRCATTSTPATTRWPSTSTATTREPVRTRLPPRADPLGRRGASTTAPLIPPHTPPAALHDLPFGGVGHRAVWGHYHGYAPPPRGF